jgi:hypothetical protein
MIAFATASLLAALSGSARADGLAELKSALIRLHGQTPVKGVLESKTWSRQGDGKDAEERNGIASVNIDESPRGLQMVYSRELLTKAENEEMAKEKNPKVATPTLSAMREISSSELRPMIFAARSLARTMEKAVFKEEKADNYGGKPARLLSFDIPLESVPEKDRKYIKKFDSSLLVWIAADGTPLASRMQQNISGRAFVVVSFESSNEEQHVYTLVGDRLVAVRKESKNVGAGMGEKGESRVIRSLQLQS